MKFEVKYSGGYGDLPRSYALPVVEVAQMLALDLRFRIERGQASDGAFSALGARSQDTPDHGLFWVPSRSPQPAGYIVKPTSGQLSGWAGYRSYKAYTQALGSPPRTFKLTGQLLDSLKVRVMGPGRVKVAFYGAHARSPKAPGEQGGGTKSNTNIAWFASRDEREPMLMPTRAELDRVRQYVRENAEAFYTAGLLQGARTRRKPATPRRR